MHMTTLMLLIVGAVYFFAALVWLLGEDGKDSIKTLLLRFVTFLGKFATILAVFVVGVWYFNGVWEPLYDVLGWVLLVYLSMVVAAVFEQLEYRKREWR